jgi:hypothetical protein
MIGLQRKSESCGCRRWILLASLLPLTFTVAVAQGSAGSAGGLEPRTMIDMPTAGMLAGESFGLDIDFYQEGGVLLGVSFGVFDRLSLGVSYGGSRLIGSDTPIMNRLPGVAVKLRVLDETVLLPALALGFDSQGRDGYLKDDRRYVIKSPGVYGVVSKNYAMLGFFSIHAGTNYSFERADGDKDINFFAGVEKTIGSVVSVVAEYNLGSNDSNGNALGKGRGYLNAGIRWSVGGGLTLGLCLKDLARNRTNDITVANRTIRLEYANPL